jgi:cell division transport system ATP-binding protein
MIYFHDVTVAFGNGVHALRNVTLEIPANDFVFLVGPSGAGKSTVLNCIMGVVTPTTGSVQVGEPLQRVNGLRGRKLAHLRQKIGFVFQDFKILSYKNVFENILVALKVKHIPTSLHKAEVMHVLKSVGLENKAFEFPIQLSAGELQRVAIARALAGDRQILLADEPTGNLDPKTTWEVMKIFMELEGKRTIIIASHNTEVVTSLKKRTISLDRGVVIADSQKKHIGTAFETTEKQTKDMQPMKSDAVDVDQDKPRFLVEIHE